MMCVWLVLGIAIFMLIAIVYERIKFRRLAAERVGENFDTFRAAFDGEGMLEEAVRAVYEYFQRRVNWMPAFPVRPADDIARMYGIVDEDLVDAVEEIVRGCGRRLPPLVKGEPPTVLVTVRDLVRAIANCPKA